MAVDTKESNFKILFKNFLGGLGWAVGATFGFTLFVAIVTFVLRSLGGLPVVGDFFAGIIEATQEALESRGMIKLR
ncbi:hypothetical protein C4578_03825 [Candidatus Microgenomates bacterium]|jgi:hypothetical protein|nr:MAG: hypothetical protein C4578_03825 [Candidatus Microgenomates bacterium]